MAKDKSPAKTPRAQIKPRAVETAAPSPTPGVLSPSPDVENPDGAAPPETSVTPAKTVRARIVLDTPEADDQHVEQPTKEEVVTVLTPKTFRLTLDNGTMVEYKAGNPTMPRSHAEHFYSIANGVSIKE